MIEHNWGIRLKKTTHGLNECEADQFIAETDYLRNGFIDFNEFLQLVAPKIIANRSERVYLEAFKVIDDSDDGLLSKEELMRANYISKAGISEEQIDQILTYVDFHYAGKFNFSNVLKMLYRTPE